MSRWSGLVAMLVVCCLGVACQGAPGPTAVPPPEPTATDVPIVIATPMEVPATTSAGGEQRALTDGEAIEVATKGIVARGVAPETVRMVIGGEPRQATVRYASQHRSTEEAFEIQRVLVTLEVSRVMARVEPALTGGLSLGAMPAGEGEIGLYMTVIKGSPLRAWAGGAMTEPEFVSSWEHWAVTSE